MPPNTMNIHENQWQPACCAMVCTISGKLWTRTVLAPTLIIRWDGVLWATIALKGTFSRPSACWAGRTAKTIVSWKVSCWTWWLQKCRSIIKSSRDIMKIWSGPRRQWLAEGFGTVEHVLHVSDPRSIPGSNGLIEARRTVEHVLHISDPWSIPWSNGLIEGLRVVEHVLHISDPWSIPWSNGLIEGVSLQEHGLHISDPWRVPGSNGLIEGIRIVEHVLHISCGLGRQPGSGWAARSTNTYSKPECSSWPGSGSTRAPSRSWSEGSGLAYLRLACALQRPSRIFAHCLILSRSTPAGPQPKRLVKEQLLGGKERKCAQWLHSQSTWYVCGQIFCWHSQQNMGGFDAWPLMYSRIQWVDWSHTHGRTCHACQWPRKYSTSQWIDWRPSHWRTCTAYKWPLMYSRIQWAEENMFRMSVTPEVSQDPMGWLKASAW